MCKSFTVKNTCKFSCSNIRLQRFSFCPPSSRLRKRRAQFCEYSVRRAKRQFWHNHVQSITSVAVECFLTVLENGRRQLVDCRLSPPIALPRVRMNQKFLPRLADELSCAPLFFSLPLKIYALMCQDSHQEGSHPSNTHGNKSPQGRIARSENLARRAWGKKFAREQVCMPLWTLSDRIPLNHSHVSCDSVYMRSDPSAPKPPGRLGEESGRFLERKIWLGAVDEWTEYVPAMFPAICASSLKLLLEFFPLIYNFTTTPPPPPP